MARILYKEKRFGPPARRIIQQANAICADYAAQGYDLTLRQLYYQFVARGLIPNKQSEYKRLGDIVSDARLAGLIDWNYIVDRTRNLRALPHWNSPADIVDAGSKQFRFDKWAEQPTRIEVWIEKDALVGVLDAVCPQEDVPFFSCRGYTSQTEVWGAAQRIGQHLRNGQNVVVLHLGDHDPSGVDMTRDIRDRLDLFISRDDVRALQSYVYEELGLPEPPSDSKDPSRYDRDSEEFQAYLERSREKRDSYGYFTINRIALNMDQVQEYDPPPNPAKLTDSRSTGYIDNYGDESWELDALPPDVLAGLIRDNIEEIRDYDLWQTALEREDIARVQLGLVAEQWNDIVSRLEEAS